MILRPVQVFFREFWGSKSRNCPSPSVESLQKAGQFLEGCVVVKILNQATKRSYHLLAKSGV